MASQRIDARALIDDSAFGGYQIGVLVLCFIAMILDGYDVQVIGVTAAGIRETLKLEPATLGIVITAGQVGVILGAVFLAPLADRLGRKRLMIASLLMFGAFSFLTAYATTVSGLIALRVLAGIGLGSIGPAALALGAEYAPKKLKASIPSWIWAAVPTGGFIAGLSAIWLLPLGGWPSLFIVAGVLPILVAIPLGLFMPESLAFIGTQRNDQAEMRRIATKIAPDLPTDAALYCSEEKLPGVPLRHLFTEGRALGTVLLWILFFLDYGILIFFLSWVPTLIKMATGSTTALGAALAFWNVGSIFCSFGIGWLVDRFGYYRVLIPAFAVIALSMFAIGAALDAPLWLLLCAITVNGAIAGSSGAALMALAANSYPLAARSTGVGAAYAFGGRFGAFVAPLFGGFMLQLHYSPATMCYIAGAPLLLGSVLLVWLRTQAHFRHGPEAAIEGVPIAAQPSV